MRIETNFNQLANTPTMISTLMNLIQNFALQLMCTRVGIVQQFNKDDLTADVLIVNKITTGLNQDGTQNIKDWAKIRAKVCFCTPYDTFPINIGDECLLLFTDREIESWFITGETSAIKHQRMHDETDCIAVFGLRSLPKMIQILDNARHIFYKNSDIQLKENDIVLNAVNLDINATTTNITSALNITGNTTQQGTISATTLIAQTGATGTFRTADNKTVTITNGIITAIA